MGGGKIGVKRRKGRGMWRPDRTVGGKNGNICTGALEEREKRSRAATVI